MKEFFFNESTIVNGNLKDATEDENKEHKTESYRECYYG